MMEIHQNVVILDAVTILDSSCPLEGPLLVHSRRSKASFLHWNFRNIDSAVTVTL